MTKTQTGVISFLVPIAGTIIFFSMINKDKPAAFNALIRAMAGMALALVVLMVLLRLL